MRAVPQSWAAVFWARAGVLGGPLKGGATGIFALENPLAPLAMGPSARKTPRSSSSATWDAWSFPRGSRRTSPRGRSGCSRRETGAGGFVPALLIALVALSLWRLSRRLPEALGFLWLCVASFPTSNLAFPTGTIFAERLAYLPSAGFCVIAASWILGSGSSFGAVDRRRRLVFAGAAILLGTRTVIQNPVWQSDETLFANMVRVSPESAKAHYDFAYVSAEHGDFRTALEHYTRATRIYPGYWDAWAGRGRMERELGDLPRLRVGVRGVAPSGALRRHRLLRSGNGPGAARQFLRRGAGLSRRARKASAVVPAGLPAGPRLLSAQEGAGAEHAWHRALAIEPASLAARLGYTEWLVRAGRLDQARAQLREILRRSPLYAPALKLKESLGP